MEGIQEDRDSGRLKLRVIKDVHEVTRVRGVGYT